MTQIQADHSTELEPFKTSDTPFAAYLHHSGMKLVGSVQDPNDSRREVCVFVRTEKTEELESMWHSGKAEGNLKKYHRSLKIVNRYVNEARRKRDEDE